MTIRDTAAANTSIGMVIDLAIPCPDIHPRYASYVGAALIGAFCLDLPRCRATTLAQVSQILGDAPELVALRGVR
ncbi:MAG TPA: hypothetical protein VEB22_15185 [Phycisphaerales bacterium]|nr:hypothetical protein [Phycisphaerales bacterium]